MGIQILDNVEINASGIDIVNAYASFGEDSIFITKNKEDRYNIKSIARVWKDKQARQDTKTHIACIPISIVVSKNQLGNNPYNYLYQELKSQYIQTQDDI